MKTAGRRRKGIAERQPPSRTRFGRGTLRAAASPANLDAGEGMDRLGTNAGNCMNLNRLSRG